MPALATWSINWRVTSGESTRRPGRRGSAARWRWAVAHYTYLLAATALVAHGGRRRRRVLGSAAAAVGMLLDRILGASTNAPWFAPVIYVKLLTGHAAGAALLTGDPMGSHPTSR